MSEEIRQRKYQFESKIRLPNMKEILDAASDFTEPSAKKLQVAEGSPDEKKVGAADLAHKAALSPEQAELQNLGNAVADEAIRAAKERELKRAEELRRLCREREELAQKRAAEEQKLADEEKKKAIQAAREKAQARKDAAAAAEAAAAAAITSDGTAPESLDDLDNLTVQPQAEKLPPIGGVKPADAEAEQVPSPAPVQETAQAVQEAPSEEPMVDISELAINPFEDKPQQNKKVKEKEEFKETLLEDDYKEEMDLREDSSESVEGDFLDL